eukprot:14431985-Heterocapsa_arctica.AAC.1
MTRSRKQDNILVWPMLAFGLKGAPLVWGRLAAALGRIMLQGMMWAEEGRMQIYLDDPCITILGSEAMRDLLHPGDDPVDLAGAGAANRVEQKLQGLRGDVDGGVFCLETGRQEVGPH